MLLLGMCFFFFSFQFLVVRYSYFEHFTVTVSLSINARTFLHICMQICIVSNSYALSYTCGFHILMYRVSSELLFYDYTDTVWKHDCIYSQSLLGSDSKDLHKLFTFFSTVFNAYCISPEYWFIKYSFRGTRV
jgi:hypothetical protein